MENLFWGGGGGCGLPRPSDNATGVHSVFVGFAGFYDTVCGHQDGTREGSEFALLLLPCSAIVAHEVRVLGLQPGIAMSWQQLAMSVYIDTFACVLQKSYELLFFSNGKQI